MLILAVMYGRMPELASQELQAVLPSLPGKWFFSSEKEVGILTSSTYTAEDLLGASEKTTELQAALQKLQARLGSAVRIIEVSKQVPREGVARAMEDLVHAYYPEPSGKLQLGVSVLGWRLLPSKLAHTLKEALRKEGYSLRTITPSQGTVLNGAQVLHNRLPLLRGKRGIELITFPGKQGWWVGATLLAQDIASYSKRDFGLPAPDPVSGMLPPKLAQTMINLVVGAKDRVVYDPFCGNGRVILEARLMGLVAYGSDIEPEKVVAAKQNLAWLEREYQLSPSTEETFWPADARLGIQERVRSALAGRDWCLVSEPYLGRPLRKPLAPEKRVSWLAELQPLYETFFRSLSGLAGKERPQAMLVVVPKARVAGGGEASLYNLLVDRLEGFGYHVEVLATYDRPDSFVRRDLVKVTYR